MLKTWIPEYKVSNEERSVLIQGVFAELAGGQPGDHTVMVGGDVLLYGAIDGEGKIHVYETRILASTEDHFEQQQDGEMVVLANRNRKAEGGRPS